MSSKTAFVVTLRYYVYISKQTTFNQEKRKYLKDSRIDLIKPSMNIPERFITLSYASKYFIYTEQDLQRINHLTK